VVPGGDGGTITRGGGGVAGAGGEVVVGAGSAGPGFDVAPGCRGGMIVDGLDTGVVAPPVGLRVSVGAGVLDAGFSFPL
jgi:hypothetical protein